MKRLKLNTAAISLRLLLFAGFLAGLLAVTIAPLASNAVLMAIDSTADNPMMSAGLTQPLPATETFSDGTTEIAAQSGSISAPATLMTFSAGSLIVPMDTDANGQDDNAACVRSRLRPSEQQRAGVLGDRSRKVPRR